MRGQHSFPTFRSTPISTPAPSPAARSAVARHHRHRHGETVNGTGGNDILPGLGGHDTIFGFAGNDTLDGGIGNDTLDGGTGNDIMMGGQGDDSYVVDSFLDAVIEKPGEGTDTVIASTQYRLAANVENLVLQGDAIAPCKATATSWGTPSPEATASTCSTV